MKKKLALLLIVVPLVALAFIVVIASQKQKSSSDYYCPPSPMECTNPTLRHIDKAQYKIESSYGIAGTGGYECSRPIKLVSTTVDKTGQAVDFIPVDTDEAKLFCHMTYAEEYKGKIKVLQKPEVLALINKYAYKDVSIKALEFKYIQDKDYVHRLLPGYKNKVIGCIIVLDTPGEDKVYLEDEKLDTFEELDYSTFTHNLNQVSPADKKLFYDNLK